jgi:23S rRNA G2445 N2-methylase RlmL
MAMRPGYQTFFASAARGTEGPLRRELARLRLHAPRGDRGGVWFEGPIEDGMAACLYSRVAMRVLLQIGELEAKGADALYEGVRSCPWHEWLDLSRTFAVQASVRDSALTHSGYAALKVKDAIADALRARLGARPNVDADDPDVSVFLHLRNDHAKLFLDLAGEPLHRRGYRAAMTDATLKETLAAAVLALSGATPELPFVDPMAGSGTFPIEQALLAREIAPGLLRHFAFERWPIFTGEMPVRWTQIKHEARARVLPRAPSPIVCADRDPRALDAARANASHARVADDLDFRVADAREIERRWPRAVLCSNPPYGERLDAPGELYEGLGRAFSRLEGWRVSLLCGGPDLMHAMGSRPEVSHRLFNGDLEVRLLSWEMLERGQRLDNERPALTSGSPTRSPQSRRKG